MEELRHHGIKGMKWGKRRFQNTDGTLTSAGKKRYAVAIKNIVSTQQKRTTPDWVKTGPNDPHRRKTRFEKILEETAKRDGVNSSLDDKQNAMSAGKSFIDKLLKNKKN